MSLADDIEALAEKHNYHGRGGQTGRLTMRGRQIDVEISRWFQDNADRIVAMLRAGADLEVALRMWTGINDGKERAFGDYPPGSFGAQAQAASKAALAAWRDAENRDPSPEGRFAGPGDAPAAVGTNEQAGEQA